MSAGPPCTEVDMHAQEVPDTPEDAEDIEDCMDEEEEEDDDRQDEDDQEEVPFLERSDSDASLYNAPTPDILESLSPET